MENEFSALIRMYKRIQESKMKSYDIFPKEMQEKIRQRLFKKLIEEEDVKELTEKDIQDLKEQLSLMRESFEYNEKLKNKEKLP